jgi:N-succinyldiaminopimelate aminotransferase
MNPDLAKLQPYPFEKLGKLLAQAHPDTSLRPIALSIGEPKHPSPATVLNTLTTHLAMLAQYPTTRGLPELRRAISEWATRRFALQPGSLDPERHVLPVNGTREALFSFTQALIDRSRDALVVAPNPFYQIYEGAACLAGAEQYLLPCLPERGFVPDYDAVPAAIWQRCQLLFLCSPGNPTGAVTDTATLKRLIALADEHDFVLASDECYSEIYPDENRPPVGLLQACAELGRNDFRRCVVFHSLSKRSNLPGLRSGFVAGDAGLMAGYLLYRTYHGCAMSLPAQHASITAWQDETHVLANRESYRRKFKAVLELLQPVMNVQQSNASFYLWPETPIDDEDFARELFAQQHVTVLPGSYLSRTINGLNPGRRRVRMALVAPEVDCIEAAERIRRFLER